MTPCGSNVYTNPDMEIIYPSGNVLGLGIYMSGDCTFKLSYYHICLKSVLIFQMLILRTFYTRDCITMLTLFKSVVLSTVRLRLSVMVAISDQTYNSTREDTTVIHQTYNRVE